MILALRMKVKKMVILNVFLVIFLVVCAIAVERTKDLLSAVIIFSAYSLIMRNGFLILLVPGRCVHL